MTLPLGRPFITACIGGAFGGGVVGLFDQLGHSVGAIAIGASDLSLLPLLNGSSGYGWALLGYGSGLIVAYVVGFVATLLFRVSGSVRADLEAQASSGPRATQTGPPSPGTQKIRRWLLLSVLLTASMLGLGLRADSPVKLATVNGNEWSAHSSVPTQQ